MRKRGRLPAFLLALTPVTALAQNLLTNPGFDRDLAGWTVTTRINQSPVPGLDEASAGWVPSDANGNSLSGSVSLHARAENISASAAVRQCVSVFEGRLVSFGARILTMRQYSTAQATVSVYFFPTADCSGPAAGGEAVVSLPITLPPAETNSGGEWRPAASQALASSGTRSARVEVGVWATATRNYGLSDVDAIADEAFLTTVPVDVSRQLLPSAAWTNGVAGSHWLTTLTLVNTGAADAAVILKFLPHDTAASPGHEFAYSVRAGETLRLDEETWELNFSGKWGAVLMASSSPSVFLQSETRTPVPGGGTVGQAVPALGPAEFAGLSGKTLAPIQENVSRRTNLVLANATEAPLTAHVALYASDGTLLGVRNVDLLPLGMTQINRVAAALGAGPLDAGRIAVSTSTPGGLVAAYASVIDNTTNDPRTLLPR